MRGQLLAVLLAVALLPVLVMGGLIAWSYQRETGRIEALAREREESAARLAEALVSQSLEGAFDGLDLVRAQAHKRSLSDQDLRTLDRALPDITSLTVTDSHGRVVAASEPTAIGQVLPWLDMPMVQATAAPFYSPIHVGALSGVPVLSIALPYTRPDGRFAGAVTAAVDLDAIRAQLGAHRVLRAAERLDIGDSRGHRFELVRPRVELHPHEPSVRYTMAISDAPWHLTVTRSLARDLARPWRAAKVGGAIVAVTLLLVGGMGVLASGRLGGAFEELSLAVSKFSPSDPTTVPTLPTSGWTSREYDDVRTAFRDLALALVSRFEAAEQTRRALEASVAELERLDALKRDFLANVSHELRTPLHHIISYISALEDGDFGPMTPEQKGATKVVLKAADHLVDEIEQLLLVSQVEAGDLGVRRDEVQLGEFLEPLADRAAERCKVKGLDLIWNVPDLAVILDMAKVRRVLTALLDNAIKFTPPRGKVEVEARKEDGGLVLEVRDTGVGIPPEALEHVFESFYQADTSSTREFGGLGIGLHLAWRLVQAMGGRIAVEPREQGGTRATVRLPGTVGVESC